MKIRAIFGIVTAAAVVMVMSGCSTGQSTTANDAPFAGKIKGTITVLTHRTDLVGTLLPTYAKQFEKLYPGTTVKWEAVTGSGEATTRLQAGNAGDVDELPTTSASLLPSFFEPLGSQATMSKTYSSLGPVSYKGKAYGITTFNSVLGFVYNKAVWKDAGITTTPSTTEELLADLQKIKDKTSATPYYTNYHDGWPLTEWNLNPGVTGKTGATNSLLHNTAPWSGNSYVNVTNRLLFDVVQKGLSEKDPTTTSWQSSEPALVSKKIATMLLGSWSIPQLQLQAKTLGTNPDDIGFFPFPYKVGGHFYASLSPDSSIGVTKSSNNKATAYAFVKWFIDKGSYADDNGAISANISRPLPTTGALADFASAGVKFIGQDSPPTAEATRYIDLMKASQIDLSGGTGIYLANMVDVARGAVAGTKSSYFDSLNKAWAQAISETH